MLQARTIKYSKLEIVESICQKLQIDPPTVSTGSTVHTEVLGRIALAVGVTLPQQSTSYRKFEQILDHFDANYDPLLDSSEHSPTGGGTISSHGWRKLARLVGALDFAFILNYSEAEVSDKYVDVLGVSYGFDDSVSGRVPLLDSGEGAHVVFYNTSKSKFKPSKAFIGKAKIEQVERFLDGKYRLHFVDFARFQDPIEKSQVEVSGWNWQNAISEITFDSFVELVTKGNVRDSETGTAAVMISEPIVEVLDQGKLQAVSNRDNPPSQASDAFEVDVRPDAGSLRIYRGMTFTAHYALGEFIDNSITSALKNKLSLTQAFGDNYELVVRVAFDSRANLLEVTDNAAGISRHDIGSALKAGATRNDNSIGLSKYGIGMKAAAFWFGSTLELETYPLGEATGWKVVLDISGEGEVPAEVSVSPIPHRGESGTVLRVKNLWNGVPKSKASTTIKRYLPSIYRSFIQTSAGDKDGVPTQIIYEGTKLEYKSAELLNEPFWENQDGAVQGAERRVWRQDVEIALKSGAKITGWVGILKTMSRDLSGLTLFYRKKAIAGAVPISDSSNDDEKPNAQDRSYRPSALFKQSGSKQDQSFVGEFDVTDLGKTITTNAPRWTLEEEEEFAAQLLQKLNVGSEAFDAGENLLKMAANFRRRPGNQTSKKTIEVGENDREVEVLAQERLDGNVQHGNAPERESAETVNFNPDDLDGRVIGLSLTDDDGHKHEFSLALGHARGADFLSLTNAGAHRHEIAVNTAHPILDSVDRSDTEIRRVIQILSLAFGIAEIFADSDEGVVIRRKFNNSLDLLGNMQELEG